MKDLGWVVDLVVTLIGTFVGVFFAFWLDRRQQESNAKKRYGDTLNAARRDLANLSSLLRELSRCLIPGRGWATMPPLEAPVVDAVRTDAAFYDQAPHGLVMCLTVLPTLCGRLRNELDHAKLVTAPDYAQLTRRASEVIRVIDYTQAVLDKEVNRLQQPVISRPEDRQIIEGLERAIRGEDQQGHSAPGSSQ